MLDGSNPKNNNKGKPYFEKLLQAIVHGQKQLLKWRLLNIGPPWMFFSSGRNEDIHAGGKPPPTGAKYIVCQCGCQRPEGSLKRR